MGLDTSGIIKNFKPYSGDNLVASRDKEVEWIKKALLEKITELESQIDAITMVLHPYRPNIETVEYEYMKTPMEIRTEFGKFMRELLGRIELSEYRLKYLNDSLEI